ncbi:xanthine dehydrogenase family protein molybdopterin-binding subunit [Pararhizobium mangrovi]|uniref:Xanthine dehydrogenase family protein molybdopterin-binding subunit n=1 Tax=Pararhizobium mangrovi TaxID=2590452 RepID=A0A506U7Z2_9HYPH|nr:molybdopterin cofactor-binding domain-containing protein [Pararhizobium mangrovi]TPW30463.1 xanthine dehydrogenase family protein molybdopterin-binding subunit [Pararhizobium mangrovi]
MTIRGDRGFSRRSFLKGSGLVVSFALLPGVAFAQDKTDGPKGPPFGDMKSTPYLDSWIGIDESGKVTIFSGKAELGQGIMTALMQCAAEQLAVTPDQVRMEMASTASTPDEGYTAGSNSMAGSGTAILNAAAQMRTILIGWAADDLGVDKTTLHAENGVVKGDGGKSRAYGDIVKGRSLHVEADGTSDLIPPDRYKVMGKNHPRLDIPAKLTGAPIYVQDMRPDGMLHARVVRPPSYTSTLQSVDTAAVSKMPGVVKVVHEGDYLAVVAKGEYQAIVALRALQEAAKWQTPKALPKESTIYDMLKSMKTDDSVIDKRGDGTLPEGRPVVSATYRRPYMMHGAIGPSCAVAEFTNGKLTVWTHSQGVFPLRKTLADMLSMPLDAIDCIQVEGSGCYGHNGADDVAADAAIIARAMPDKPIRVQWMREDEHGWEPYGSPMIAEAKGTLDDDGRISGWNYELWSMTFSTRPGGSANNLMPAWYLPKKFGPPKGGQIPLPGGGGDRNAIPTYDLANTHVLYHYIDGPMPIRISALRSLGGYLNTFAVESFMDEMALAAKTDPVAFRLKHVKDPRARDVIEMAAGKFGWKKAEKLPPYRGRGFAYVRYETVKAYCALAVEIEVDPVSGQIRVRRAVAAIDSGNAVNPNGIQNQIEGCIIQATSWSLHERVAFTETEIMSRDWSSYPILRFDGVPDSVEVHVIDRPGAPFLGTGEAGMGPTPAAIANALYDATGLRMRDLPFHAEAVRTAMLGPDAKTKA